MNRYSSIPTTKIKKKLVYTVVRYPEVPLDPDDIYVYTVKGDRFDMLARQYYNDSSFWWIISVANTGIAGTASPSDLPQDSLIIPEGIQIRIPNNPVAVINSFNSLNS
jgi:phage tail protein X